MTTTPEHSPAEKISALFRALSASAVILNAASDNLGAAVSQLDTALKKLNLGIVSWHRFRAWHSEDHDDYTFSDLGYAKVNGKWGLALKRGEGTSSTGEEYSEQWLFNDAPRALRIEAVHKIPDFLEKLNEDALNTSNQLNEKAKEVTELASAIGSSKPEKKSGPAR